MAKSRKRRRRRRPPSERRVPKLPRAAEAGPATAQKAARSPRRSVALDQRPPAPWGSFPLQELTVFVGLVMLAVGFFTGDPVWIGVGLVLGCLGGLELAAREHFAGYRSHTILLAGTAFVLTVATLTYFTQLILLICLICGAAVFLAAAAALRSAFRRASGGLSFKFGGLRS